MARKKFKPGQTKIMKVDELQKEFDNKRRLNECLGHKRTCPNQREKGNVFCLSCQNSDPIPQKKKAPKKFRNPARSIKVYRVAAH